MNRDLLNQTNARRAGNAVMAVINGVDRGNFQPHEQLVGLAAAFLFVSEHWGIPAQDVFTITKNLINGVEGIRPEFAAARDYIKQELR